MKDTVGILESGDFISSGGFYTFFLSFKNELYKELVKLGAYKIDIMKGHYRIFCFFSFDFMGFTRIYRIETGEITEDWSGIMEISEVDMYYVYERQKRKAFLNLRQNFIGKIDSFLLA